jgi:hypothetical protein
MMARDRPSGIVSPALQFRTALVSCADHFHATWRSLAETATTGRELSLFFPGDLGPGSPGALIFIVGSSREVDDVPGPTPNPFGFTTLSFEVLSGQTENLCETMA